MDKRTEKRIRKLIRKKAAADILFKYDIDLPAHELVAILELIEDRVIEELKKKRLKNL